MSKKIRLIELFAGYGSQHLALPEAESWRIAEWAVKSCEAYNDLHIRDYTDYSEGLTKTELINDLIKRGISLDWKTPATYEKLKKLNIEKLKKFRNDIIATHNLVDVSKIHASDLNICETDKYDYILTCSSPCQNLSIAGDMTGMAEGSGTCSSLIWEIVRILNECENLPHYLVFENVVGLQQQPQFNDLLFRLSKIGYQLYFKNLQASDYGIPQSRKRTFIVGILNKFDTRDVGILEPSQTLLPSVYIFPQPLNKNATTTLKTYLEPNSSVDDKYYMSPKMLNYMLGETQGVGSYNRREVFLRNYPSRDIAGTITCAAGQRPTDNFIFEPINEQTRKREGKAIYNNCYIRKLTPLEIARLMGLTDKQFYLIAANKNDATLYHLFGDSIVVKLLHIILNTIVFNS